MGRGIGSFGEGFMEGFTAVSHTMEERKRTKVAEAAEARAQSEWEQKLQDIRDTRDDMNFVSTTTQARTNEMAQMQKDAAAAAAASTPAAPPPAAMTAPASPAPSDVPAPGTAAPAAAVGLQPPPSAAPSVKLNLQGKGGMTPQNLATIAADISKTRGVPLQQAMSMVTDAMTTNGPATTADGVPPAAQQTAATSAAPTPAVAAGIAATAPAPAATGLRPDADPGLAVPPPAAEADAVPPPAKPTKPPNMKQLADHARETTRMLMPRLIKMVSRSNPVEGAKMAATFASEAVQDRMTKTIMLAGLLKSPGGASDPAVEPLLQEVYPGYVPNSFVGHPPDKDGNISARLQQKMPDGSVQSVGVFPAFIDSMLTTALSPLQILEQERLAKDASLKEREFVSQDKKRMADEKHAADTLTETIREHKAGDEERSARTKAYVTQAESNQEYKTGQLEARTAAAKTATETAAVNTGMKILGIGPTTPPDDPARVEGGKSLGWARGMLEENGLPFDSSNLARVLPYIVGIRGGDVSSVRTKDGKYFLDMGTGTPLKMPYVDPETRKRIEAAKAKASVPRATTTPAQPQRGLQPQPSP